ncbi:MAG: FtsH protease activity modulator HflK [Rhodospirillaceae bacterium]|nr:FtsH protease activity modulator HflK [Rhodospirillaceae bacterium]|tara:strand:+ start:721 stop:1848 length:1128 start_codon:yes stop_codon:yes gene_type:complete
MSWDDGNKNNPWQQGGGKGPADLDQVVKDLQKKLTKVFGGSRRGGDGNGNGANMGGSKPASGMLGSILVALIGVWAVTGFYVVDDAERGIVLRFGQFQSISQPGLRWKVPWPVDSVELINTNVTERFDYQGSMLTEDENIVLVDLVVQYRRTDPEAYLFNMRNPSDTLMDVTSSAIREVIGKNLLDFILTEGRAEVAAETQALIQSTLDTYGTGITVYEVNLQDANFPRDVEESVQDAIRAREDKERMALAAEAYANDILPKARGSAARQLQDAEAYRDRVIADAEGESDRFVQILLEYEKAPEVTRQRMYLDTLEEVLSNSTKVLLDSEGGGNMIYLPLDRLMERGSSQQQNLLAPSAVPMPNSSPSARVRDSR